MTGRPPFLLLDPPSPNGFWRRSSTREKDAALSTPFPSIDLILLSGAVRDAGFKPVFVDAQLDNLNWDGLAHRLRREKFAGLVSLTSSSMIEEEFNQLKRLKDALGGVPCYAVGTVVIQRKPQRLRKLLEMSPWVDGLILNTAEHNLGELISAPGGDGPVPFNVALRTADTLVIPELRVSYGDSLRIPQPEHACFKDFRYCLPQSRHGPVTCVQFSFGCPYTCEFCVDNQLYRKTLYRDVEDMVDEMAAVDRLGFREAYFKDVTFGLDQEITTEFLEKLAARKLRLRWLCSTRVEVARAEMLTLMKRAGCYGIEIGVEHGKQSSRDRVGKTLPEHRIREVFETCRRLGISTTAFIMLAFDDDTEEDVRETIRFARSLRPNYAAFNVLNALPGTPYEERARREGFLLEQSADYRFMASNIKHRHLTPEKVEQLRREALRSFYFNPRAILKRLVQVRSLFELRKLVRLSLSVV